MSDLDQAIKEFRDAVNEFGKREAARHVGVAVGEAVGANMYAFIKSEAQIDAMSLPELETWVDNVKANPPA